MELIFLGTGAAWGLPELHCTCKICEEMRRKGEKRTRTALLMKSASTLLIDCGPDIRSQLSQQPPKAPGAVLITHEHGDHYIGLDELFVYKRLAPKGTFEPIPVYLSGTSWKVIGRRFDYLEDMGVIKTVFVEPGRWFTHREWRIFPFKTDHGAFAAGSLGYLITCREPEGEKTNVLYTSDFMELPDLPLELLRPDYLVIQSFWLNEPEHNRPRHMSFQRAIPFISRLEPRKGTFLVHMGDADMVPGDPANAMLKKYRPLDPLKPPGSDTPYSIPMNQEQWEATVNRILRDRNLDYRIIVAQDGIKVTV
ncbi:MAG: MBL fold metallo-hydrolase [Desulfatiglandaceae bacterium]|jgi:phosphoribosyl 1,2-cyclic phosphate phosphodiesterase